MGSNGQETWGSLLHHSWMRMGGTHSSAWSSPRMLKYPREPCCQKPLQNLSEVLAAQGKAKGLSEKQYHPFMKTELPFFPYRTFTSSLQKCSHHSHLVRTSLQTKLNRRKGHQGTLQRKQTRSTTTAARMNGSLCGEGKLRQLHPHITHTTTSAPGLLRC